MYNTGIEAEIGEEVLERLGVLDCLVQVEPTGLVANRDLHDVSLLGREGESCRFWGVALRGAGLGVATLGEGEMEEERGRVQFDSLSCGYTLMQDMYIKSLV